MDPTPHRTPAPVDNRRGDWTTPHAHTLLPADAPEPVWLTARRNGIGGSDAAPVLGMSRFNTPLGVYMSKVHDDDRDSTADMRWGKFMEPVLRVWFTQETGLAVRRCGLLAHRARPWQIATPDGLTADGGIVEYKTTRTYLGDAWDSDQTPDDAEIQVQHLLAVTGRTHGYVVVSIGGTTPIVRRIPRDASLIADLTTIEQRFWSEHVEPRIPPPLQAPDLARLGRTPADGSVIDTPGAALLDAVDDYRAALARRGDAEWDADLAAATLLDLLGGAVEVYTDPTRRHRLLTCRASAFRPAEFAAAHPELAARHSRIPDPVVSGPAVRVAQPELWRAHCTRVLRLSRRKAPTDG